MSDPGTRMRSGTATGAGPLLLTIRDLVKVFPLSDSDAVVQACEGISLDVFQKETLGLVGESGSGKTTLGRCMVRLLDPTSGAVTFQGRDLTALSRRELRALRSDMQMVFQEPLESLNPRLSIGRQIAEPLRLHTGLNGTGRARRVRELLDQVGLPPHVAALLPVGVSSGAAQRVSIARAIATEPKLIILDEPTSALAPEEEADIITLLGRLQDELGIAYVFISHDLSLIGEVADRIAVMYLSQVVETGTTTDVFARPGHPYTRALLASTLRPDPGGRQRRAARRERLEGEIPSPIDLPQGCYLASRCGYVRDRCRAEPQPLQRLADGRQVRCWRVAAGDIDASEFAQVSGTGGISPRLVGEGPQDPLVPGGNLGG